MARRDIIVSDFSGAVVAPEELAVVTVRFSDGRRGMIIADAAPDDEIIDVIARAGRRQKRRGRKSAATLEAELATQAAAAGRRGRRAKASA